MGKDSKTVSGRCRGCKVDGVEAYAPVETFGSVLPTQHRTSDRARLGIRLERYPTSPIMSILKVTLWCCCLVSANLFASTGPGNPPRIDTKWLDNLLTEAADSSSISANLDFAAPADAEERAAIAAMFAPPPVLSDRSDDVRSAAELVGAAKESVDKAKAMFDKIHANGLYVQNLVEDQLENLPIGIPIPLGNVTATIAIGEIKFTPTHATVDVFLELDYPTTDDDPIFVARNITWTRTGGFDGTVTLELMTDWGIDLQEGKSRLILHQKNESGSLGCFAKVTCKEFVSAQLDGTIILSRDWVIPVVNGAPLVGEDNNNARDARSAKRVHANVFANVTDDAGLFFRTRMNSPFIVKGLDDVQITAGDVVVDYSSVSNATSPSMTFPEGYRSPYVDPISRQASNGLEGRLPKGHRSNYPRAVSAGR